MSQVYGAMDFHKPDASPGRRRAGQRGGTCSSLVGRKRRHVLSGPCRPGGALVHAACVSNKSPQMHVRLTDSARAPRVCLSLPSMRPHCPKSGCLGARTPHLLSSILVILDVALSCFRNCLQGPALSFRRNVFILNFIEVVH